MLTQLQLYWRTKDEIIDAVVEEYLQDCNYDNHPNPRVAMAELEEAINNEIAMENAVRPKTAWIKRISKLPESDIAEVMITFYPIKNVLWSGTEKSDDNYQLSIYHDSGDKEGIYSSSLEDIKQCVRKFQGRFTTAEFNEILFHLKMKAPVVKKCMDRNISVLKNGLFYYKEKQLMPFNRDLVFTAKADVCFNPFASDVTYKSPDGYIYSTESWFSELSANPDVVNLLWQVIGSTLRPYEEGFSLLINFYSSCGSSGKGCITQIIRSILGYNNTASIPLAKMGDRFALMGLLKGAIAIINDENNVSNKQAGYIANAEELKTLVTADLIRVEEKFKGFKEFNWHGRIINCQNSKIRSADSSDSFWRRQLWIEFDRNFSKDGDRRYIKNDYLKRQEVLEYIIYRVLVLMPDYYEFDVPDICIENLNELKEYNSDVRCFWNEFRERISFRMAPFKFLYALYCAFARESNPGSSPKRLNVFKDELLEIVKEDPLWECEEPKKRYKCKNYYDCFEPLIRDYRLESLMNSQFLDWRKYLIYQDGLSGIIKRDSDLSQSDNDEI